MEQTKLVVSENLSLSLLERGDKDALVEQLNERCIYEMTLRIPYPYTETDAEKWIKKVTAHESSGSREITLAIRNETGLLIGVISAERGGQWTSHRAEIGYWLARPYWGRGIMTQAVRRFVDYLFEEIGLSRITAEVFARNPASGRVLEKAGFTLEGRLRKHIEKDGDLIDNLYYGLLREEWLANR